MGSLLFLIALTPAGGRVWVALLGGIINLTWALSEKLPLRAQCLLPPWVLIANTIFSAYGVLSGGPATLALVAAGGSLISWNAGLLARRWPNAPPDIQFCYIRHLGRTVALGLGAGLSALALQGHFSLKFLPAFFLLLIGGVLFLRLISREFQRAK